MSTASLCWPRFLLPTSRIRQPSPHLQASDSIVFPHIGAGVGGSVILSTQIVLINPSRERLTGEIRLTASDGMPLQGALGGMAGSKFPYELEPDGTFQTTLTSSQALVTGYAVVSLEQGSVLPVGTAIFQFRDDGGSLVSEAGVGATPPTTRTRIFVDTNMTQTGVAIASPGNDASTVTFELLDRNGFSIDSDDREVPAAGHLARFVDELFALPLGFTGLIEIRSQVPIVPITLKLTTNRRGDSILTTLPVADLMRASEATSLVIPQVGFGPDFSTRIILIGTGTESRSLGNIVFTQSNGTELVVPVLGQMGSDFSYVISPGGARQLRPGNTATVAEIVLDPSESTLLEVVVNKGNTVFLRPQIVDTKGEFRDDFPLAYNSLDGEIARVDELGAIIGEKEGFSTLTLSAGRMLRTATITVVKVTSGAAGVEIKGVAQDPAERLYLANQQKHTILVAQDLEAIPDVYAGQDEIPGLRDEERLKALFQNPAFLSLNQANASLYVSDGANHVIRRVEPGPAGRVETLAGTGQIGNTDGSLDGAAFNNPQGIVLDDRGSLWVADSANHTIRRIDLIDKTVVTIAGKSGTAGLVDGMGAQARFNSPLGIAIERESLAQQLERESRPGPPPPPPVSVIVADTGNGVIRRVKEKGEVETIGASGQATSSETGTSLFGARLLVFDSPTGVAVDPFGNIYVTEPGSGEVKTILSSGELVAARQADRFSQPQGLAIAESGKVVVADALLSTQQIVHGVPEIISLSPPAISSQGGDIVTIRGRNFAPGSSVVAAGVVIADAQVEDSQTITFVAPTLPSGRTTLTVQNRGGLAQISLLAEAVPLGQLAAADITTVAGGSTFAGDGSLASEATLNLPSAVAVDATGNLFIADLFNHRIRKVDAATSIITTVAGNGELGFSGDGGPAAAAALGLSFPAGSALAVDAGGNFFIAEESNDRIRKVDAATGIITTVAGSGVEGFFGDDGPATAAALADPSGVAVDAAGNLFIADTLNHLIRRVDAASGIITSVAGSGFVGFSGDGGPATRAELFSPSGVAVDAAGNLFIADTFNHRVRKVDAATGIITSVAGSAGGFSGDGGPATTARLASPEDVALGAVDDLFIADRDNNRIRKVDAAGIIATVAGSGERGFSGDGGPATVAALASPSGVGVGTTGNLFIADRDNNRIRKVDAATGIITTVAGSGGFGFSGDGGPATAAELRLPDGVAVDSAGNLIIADTFNHRIRMVDAATRIVVTVAGTGQRGSFGDGGAATAAELDRPRGVTVDSAGNLIIADTFNDRIRRVDAATGIITTVAGSGGFGFSGDGGPATAANLGCPFGVAVDAAGNLFIADQFNDRIRVVDAVTGIITTLAGSGEFGFSGDGGPASETALAFPSGVAVDAAGNLSIADRFNHRILKVDTATGIIDTVAGTSGFGFSGDGGPANVAELPLPEGVAVDAAGNLYIADRFNRRIRRVDAATGIITTVAGSGEGGFSGDGGPATETALSFPAGVALDGAGNLLIGDTLNLRVRKVDAVTGILTTLAGSGERILLGEGGPATAATLTFPHGVAVDASDNLFIADTSNDRIRKVDAASGIITTVAGSGESGFFGDAGPATTAMLSGPSGVAADASDNLFIADAGNVRIRKVDAATGIITTVAGNGNFGFSGDGGPATEAALGLSFFSGSEVVPDAAGNLFIADTFNHRVRKVDAVTGIITTVAGSGEEGFSGDGGAATAAALSSPLGVAVDSIGNLFITDRDNNRVRKVDAASGIISTVAGSGEEGFSGDGGAATAAALSSPLGVAVDAIDNLFIADAGNVRIRKVDAATGIITTVAGSGGFGFSGDGGRSTTAALRLGFPAGSGVAVDSAGNLFIADTFNHRVRAVRGVAAARANP